ncbi:MAG TPA: SIS domain-containing protein [Acidimicrobiia bacterium]|nr:SIS domain-containing protein [Acidimicrobiia bacterium]
MTLYDEIHEQPVALERVLSHNANVYADVAGLFGRCTHAVIAARGTSDNAARYAQYAWGLRNGISVALATPSLFSIYDRPPVLEGAMVIGISQSGQSPDIVAVLDEGRRQGRPTVSITNDPDSPLAAASDTVIPLHAGPETAVAATKTYTAQLAVIASISAELEDADTSLDHLPDLVAAALAHESSTRTAAESLGDVGHAAVLGRGFNLATAFEWALKMQELSYVVAQPFSTADFLHGPVAVVDSGYPVLAVAAEGPTVGDISGALDRSRDRGAPTVVITNSDQVASAAGQALRFEAGEEWLTPLPAIAVAQMFTYWLTLSQGNDPDTPRGLSKVTRTT